MRKTLRAKSGYRAYFRTMPFVCQRYERVGSHGPEASAHAPTQQASVRQRNRRARPQREQARTRPNVAGERAHPSAADKTQPALLKPLQILVGFARLKALLSRETDEDL